MNEQEKEQLASLKPDIALPLVEELAVRLEAFRQFGQYEVLSGVHLAQFFSDPESVPGTLKQRTLEQLVFDGALVLSLEPEVTSHHLMELLVILSRFTPEREDIPNHAPNESKVVTPHIAKQNLTKQHSDVPVLGSVDAERQLVERYEKLRNDPDREHLSLQKVGQYWDTSIIRAPFLEEITFREVLEISVDNLLKKRTVGNTKIFCLIQAFDRLLAEGVRKGVSAEEPLLDVEAPQWEPLSENRSCTATALVFYWETLRERFLRSNHSENLLSLVLTELPRVVSQDEFVALWSFADGEVLEEEFASLLEPAQKALLEMLYDRASEQMAWVESSVEGLGATEEFLLVPLKIPTLPVEIATVSIRMILGALAARGRSDVLL